MENKQPLLFGLEPIDNFEPSDYAFGVRREEQEAIIMLDQDGEEVGSLSFEVENPDHAYLYLLFIRSGHGQGRGKMLYRQTLNYLLAKNPTLSEIEFNTSNPKAMKIVAKNIPAGWNLEVKTGGEFIEMSAATVQPSQIKAVTDYMVDNKEYVACLLAKEL